MDGLTSFVQFVASPLMPVMEALVAALAGSEYRAPNDIDSTVAAFAVSTCLIGIVCVLSTCWIHARLRKLRRRAVMDIAMADAALYFREALLEEAARGVVVLHEGGQDRSATTPEADGATRTRTSLIVNGQHRAYATGSTPLSANCVAEFAPDVTDQGQREAAMQLALDAREDVLEHSPLAVAVFDRNQKLVSCNRAYCDLWGLPREWLAARLSYGEILERLRDERKLPERRNFPDWKLAHTSAISMPKGKVEETWHLPSGKSVQITAWPHLQGGFFLQVEDITERLHWQAEFNLQAQVQKAILDTLCDGIAIFGTDGRLVLHNERFAAIWKLSDSDLEQQPHFTRIADLCSAKIGRDGIWGIVSCGINSGAPESLGEWGKTKRADGRTISLTLSRLPNGSTVANFADLTDLERFDGITNDRPYALA
jgi:PAS domain-containing protein